MPDTLTTTEAARRDGHGEAILALGRVQRAVAEREAAEDAMCLALTELAYAAAHMGRLVTWEEVTSTAFGDWRMPVTVALEIGKRAHELLRDLDLRRRVGDGQAHEEPSEDDQKRPPEPPEYKVELDSLWRSSEGGDA
jgi:hypothetical protein